MNFKYTFGLLLAAPILPLMYFQGKKIKRSVVKLPEAKGAKGRSSANVQNGKLNVLLIGESTFAGVGVERHQMGFAGSFADELSRSSSKEINWRVYARSGYTAKRIQHKILPKIEEDSTDLILVGIGGNDAFKLSKPKKWRQDVNDLINAIQEQFAGTPIVFCNLPPIKLFPAFTSTIKFVVGNLVEVLGEELAMMVDKYDQVYFNEEVITLSAWMTRFDVEGSTDDFFSDGVHPSRLTYRIWGKEMARVTIERFLPHLRD